MQVSGLIGVIHLPPMPGDPVPGGATFARVLEAAVRDAATLARGGVDALIVENFGSTPFPKGTPDDPCPPHQLATLTLAVDRCRAFGIPVGVNVLRNDARAAIGIAAAARAAFVRINVHVGAYVTDQGVIEGRAHHTLRYRQQLNASNVAILADVQVKHAVPLAPTPLAREVADCLDRGRADGVIITGSGTGGLVDPEDLRTALGAAGSRPVLIGSGMSIEHAHGLAPLAHGAIVGTSVKQDGLVTAPVDELRVRALVEATEGRFRTLHS